MLLPHDDRCKSPSHSRKWFDPTSQTMHWILEVRSEYGSAGTQRLGELMLSVSSGSLTTSIKQITFETGDSGD